MEFRFEFPLSRSRAEVWRAFDNPDNLRKWQPSLVSFVPVSGTPGQPGAISTLTYRDGNRTILMTETITLRREPEEFSGTYRSSMGTSTIHNQFESTGPASTRWLVTARYQFHGLWRLLSPFFKGTIRKRMDEELTRFKTQLESGQL